MLCYSPCIKVPLLLHHNGHFLPVILILFPQVSSKWFRARFMEVQDTAVLLAVTSHIGLVTYQIYLPLQALLMESFECSWWRRCLLHHENESIVTISNGLRIMWWRRTSKRSMRRDEEEAGNFICNRSICFLPLLQPPPSSIETETRHGGDNATTKLLRKWVDQQLVQLLLQEFTSS